MHNNSFFLCGALSVLLLAAACNRSATNSTTAAATDAAAATMSGPPSEAPSPGMNSLTAAERREGWRLLFNGENTQGWHSYGKAEAGPAWKVHNGILYLDKSEAGLSGGDLTTDDEFQDFDFRLDWRIAPCGNSGIMYNVVEAEQYDTPWKTGPEMQILDNACHPDAKIHTHRAGDLYDMIAASPENVKPAGQWNEVRLVSRNGMVEHWLNGQKVVEYSIKDSKWNEMIGRSKFKDMPGFGRSPRGRIALQDHGDRVEFRNIKIRKF